jgi:Carboxypeptidase regulatory-like domain
MGDLTVMKMRPGVENLPKQDRIAARVGTEQGVWHYLRNVLAVALLLSCLGVSAKAQDVASITGTVVDKNGDAVSDADVKLTDTRTGATFQAKTGSFGAYLFSRVPAGSGYSVTVSKAGFKTTTISNVTLAVTETATHDVALELGEITDRVEVSASAGVTLNTTDATIGNDIDTRRVANLPSLFRTNAAALLQLAPGVVAADDNGHEADSQLGSVTGSRADQGNITLDGLDVNDESIGQAFTAVGSAPIDSIEEVHTTVGGLNAGFGRGSGGQIALVTKSGSNDFHGSLHEYNRNTLFAANDFFNNKNDIAKPPLNRNQFGGSIGGPILKDKLFFFFNYEGRRDSLSAQIQQVVPSDTFRSGQLNYIDAAGDVATTTTPQLQSIDPQGVGANAAFLAFVNSRYPVGNDPALGDGLNTTGFIFNAPIHRRDNIYTGRLDYSLSTKHKLFGRLQMDRFNDDDSVNVLPQFPGDPSPQVSDIDHDRSWVVGETWFISPTLTNQAFVGVSTQVFDTPVNFAPTAPNIFSTSLVSNPYADIRGQGRTVSVPEVRDDLTWTHGNHSLTFGTDIKPIRVKTANQADISFVSIGIDNGSSLNSLDASTRPADISGDAFSLAEWDRAFTLLLGRYNQTDSFLAYDHDGNALPQYSTTHRDFHYNEYEFYAQDSWKARRDLTITYGLRWQFHSVPFEANGFEAVPTANISDIFPARVASAAAGISGNDAAPLVGYQLGGPANKGPDYYKPSYKDFGPRFAIAYSPSFTSGLKGALFGDRKTTVRAGGAIVYDRVLSTLSFELDQQTFVFDQNPILNYGGSDPTTALLTSPRFTSLGALPAAPAVPAVRPLPIFPNTDATGAPVGLANGGFPGFLQIDKNLKTPYSDTFSFGVQRELKGNLVVEVDYFGRLGRRLIAVGDAAQTVNFKDKASGQLLKNAFAQLQTQVQKGQPITPQPWFENQLSATGFDCTGFDVNCTSLVADFFGNFVQVGDLSSTILELALNGILNPNTGLYAQTGANGYVGNYSSSSYNAMLASVRKRYSNGLQVDFDYSYSHSIDNQSNIVNDSNQFTFSGQGLICDLTNLRTCRADSLFDARHIVSMNYVYDLPVGRGHKWLGNTNGFVNTVLGGWSTSGILTYRTGFPFNTHTATFPINFTQDAPAVFNGDQQAVRAHIHTDPNSGAIQFFADQTTALGAFSFPFGGDTGTRNPVHGPGYGNLDIAVYKSFTMPWSEHHKLQFRWEAFNVFNHVNFAAPGDPTLLTNSNNIQTNPQGFGVISSTAGSPRQMQFSLRYDF